LKVKTLFHREVQVEVKAASMQKNVIHVVADELGHYSIFELYEPPLCATYTLIADEGSPTALLDES